MSPSAERVDGFVEQMSSATICSALHDYLFGGGIRETCVLGDLRSEAASFLLDTDSTREDYASLPWHCEQADIDVNGLQKMIASGSITPAVKTAIQKFGKDKILPNKAIEIIRKEIRNARRELRNTELRP